MQNLWSGGDAKAAIAHHATKGIGEDLALRVYTTRLLGGEPRLVLHGGGNTSVKTRMADVTGEPVEVLCVKGSGWDMATIEAPGLPAVRLAPLGSLFGLQALSDEDMVNVQRCNLLTARRPTRRSRRCCTPSCRTSSSTTRIPTPCCRSPTSRTARRWRAMCSASAPRWCPTSCRASRSPEASEVSRAHPDVEG
jgi:hypothetical protein